jgi:hypothetical protein
MATEQQEAIFQLSDRLDLRIDSNDGDVIIRTEPGLREVQVKAVLTTWGATEYEAKENIKNIKLEMIQSGDQVILRHIRQNRITIGIYRGEVIDFEILMPEEADLVINLDDGDVIANNIKGNIKIDSDDGKVDLSHVTGQFDLKSDDGNITITDAIGSLHAVADDGDIWFTGELVGAQHYARTDDGDITIVVPSESDLHINITVDDGHIHSTLPIEGRRDDHHWSVSLNAPLSVLTLIADDGSISIRDRKE